MNNTLVGETENFQALINMKAIQEVEGWPTIQMKYLGGLKMLLDFESVEEKNDSLYQTQKPFGSHGLRTSQIGLWSTVTTMKEQPL